MQSIFFILHRSIFRSVTSLWQTIIEMKVSSQVVALARGCGGCEKNRFYIVCRVHEIYLSILQPPLLLAIYRDSAYIEDIYWGVGGWGERAKQNHDSRWTRAGKADCQLGTATASSSELDLYNHTAAAHPHGRRIHSICLVLLCDGRAVKREDDGFCNK